MALFPTPEPIGGRNPVRGAVRAIDIATGGVVGQIGRVFGSKGSSGSEEVVPAIGRVSSRPISRTASDAGLPQWGNLSQHLIGRIYIAEADGSERVINPGTGRPYGHILAPATEVRQEVTLNWQSPFENSGPESKAPTIMAMLQTGQFGIIANALQSLIGFDDDSKTKAFLNDLAGNAEQMAKDLTGRTGITKLNSRQVFSGMPPVKITMTMHFKAFSDPQREVLEPYQRLMEWAMPKRLAKDGVLSELIKQSGSDFVKSLFPSEAPDLVGFRFAGNRYAPMVIESLGNPLDGPIDEDGRPLFRAVQLTLATLTALDRNDVARILSRSVS